MPSECDHFEKSYGIVIVQYGHTFCRNSDVPFPRYTYYSSMDTRTQTHTSYTYLEWNERKLDSCGAKIHRLTFDLYMQLGFSIIYIVLLAFLLLSSLLSIHSEGILSNSNLIFFSFFFSLVHSLIPIRNEVEFSFLLVCTFIRLYGRTLSQYAMEFLFCAPFCRSLSHHLKIYHCNNFAACLPLLTELLVVSLHIIIIIIRFLF